MSETARAGAARLALEWEVAPTHYACVTVAQCRLISCTMTHALSSLAQDHSLIIIIPPSLLLLDEQKKSDFN